MQIKEMKYCKLRWLIMIIAVFFLWGHQENACSDQNMICPTEGSPANEIPACKTRLLSDDEAEVTCAPTITAPQVRLAYRCAAVVRDWTQPSPYAHASRIWTCTSGHFKTLLFDQDFTIDATRCNQTCGRCATGWQPKE
jgi:hypothetical protein